MSELWSEFESVKEDIVTTKAKLEMAEQAKDRDLVIANTNLLTSLYQKEQRLENSGIVLNLKTIFLYSCCLHLWYIIIYVFVGWNCLCGLDPLELWAWNSVLILFRVLVLLFWQSFQN